MYNFENFEILFPKNNWKKLFYKLAKNVYERLIKWR